MRLLEALKKHAGHLTAQQLEAIYRTVDPDLPVIWNTRLRTCAGRCRRITVDGGGSWQPTSIELNPKLRTEGPAATTATLLHEVAHAMSPGDRGHGHDWRKACAAIGLGYATSRCHSYKSMPRKRRAVTRGKCDRCGKIYRLPQTWLKDMRAGRVRAQCTEKACLGTVKLVRCKH